MAKYNDDYTRVTWQNYPSIATPINETNLNKMDSYLKTISERIAELSTYTPCVREVIELPEQGVEGLFYVLNNSETVQRFSTDGLPSQFQSQSALNTWTTNGNYACILHTSEDSYVLVINCKLSAVSDSNDDSNYYYKVEQVDTGAYYYFYDTTISRWDDWQGSDISSLSVGSCLFICDDTETGTSLTPYDDTIVISTSTGSIDSEIGLDNIIGVEGVTKQATSSSSVEYSELDDTWLIYTGGAYTVGKTVYMWNEGLNDYVTLENYYSAGNGLNLSNANVFSVDTSVIQEKLTAGSGINITNNVISATGGGGGTSYTAGVGIEINNSEISTPQIVYRGTWYDDSPAYYSKTHTFSQIYAMKDNLTKENFHLYALGPSDEDLSCYYISINQNMIVLQFLYGFNVGLTTKLVKIVITHASDDTVQVGKTLLVNSTGLENGISAGDGISITNGVISVSYDNGDVEEY